MWIDTRAPNMQLKSLASLTRTKQPVTWIVAGFDERSIALVVPDVWWGQSAGVGLYWHGSVRPHLPHQFCSCERRLSTGKDVVT